MEILVQARVPISRPDDFFAEMLKSDAQMAKVKSRLLQQQVKVQTFEERKQRLENKKFHRAMKAFKQTERHREKRQNLEAIARLKQQVRAKGGDDDQRDFDRAFKQGPQAPRTRVVDAVRGQRTKPIEKKKRAGKVARNKHKQRNKKRR